MTYPADEPIALCVRAGAACCSLQEVQTHAALAKPFGALPAVRSRPDDGVFAVAVALHQEALGEGVCVALSATDGDVLLALLLLRLLLHSASAVAALLLRLAALGFGRAVPTATAVPAAVFCCGLESQRGLWLLASPELLRATLRAKRQHDSLLSD